MSAAIELAPLIGIVLACVSLGVSRATFYRVQQGPAVVWRTRPRACPRPWP